MKNWNNKDVVCIHEDTKKALEIGDTITSFRGEVDEVRYFEPPHKPSASGKINGFYAGVYGCKYVEV